MESFFSSHNLFPVSYVLNIQVKHRIQSSASEKRIEYVLSYFVFEIWLKITFYFSPILKDVKIYLIKFWNLIAL